MDTATEKNEKEYDLRAKEWQAAMATNFGHLYLEKPAMAKMLPYSLVDKNVLCIGVGSGDELEEILKRNPNNVVGIDISNNLLDIARTRFPQVEFLKMDMTRMMFEDNSFDFIYSSLTFHYARDWDVLLAEVGRVLKDGGLVLFSTHHPIKWGNKNPTGNSYTNPRGITLTEHTAILPGDIEVIYYNHASENAIREALEHAGFCVKSFIAPPVVDVPLDVFNSAEKEEYLKFKENNSKKPIFLVVSAINCKNRG
ncbi:MAG: class I SAM-dependent methyltransferase [Candidatus Pacebacteria bacterium]|nr:class I SAM-dependent methyltransferase [Candidatus Paceibacterota bacterium]